MKKTTKQQKMREFVHASHLSEKASGIPGGFQFLI
jgi:hypothetical protein